MRNLAFIFLTISLFSCNSQKLAKDADFDVSTLTTVELREKFLVDILNKDQIVRENEVATNEQFGYESKKHLEARNEVVKYDRIHLPKIEAYLEEFGYPNKQEFSEDAVITPWLIIHHAQSETSPRRRNFKYIYSAYLKEDIDGNALSFYLNRIHEREYGERYKSATALKESEEIELLIELLELTEEAEKLRSSLL